VLQLDRWERLGFIAFAVCLMNFFGITRSFISARFVQMLMVAGLVAGIFTLGRFLWLSRRGFDTRDAKA